MIDKTRLPLSFFATLILMVAGIGWLSTNSPKSGADLLGMTYAEVIEVLGVPDVAGSGGEHVEFCYPSEDGESVSTVWFHDNCAFWVKPGFNPSAPRKPIPDSGIYVGQPIEDLVRISDQPEKLSVSPIHITLHYADGKEVTIGHGMVLDVEE